MGRYIAVAGNMGAGKSSIVEFLCRHFNVKPLFEPNTSNPYLEDFYKDMKSYAFHSQLYFLSQKFKMMEVIRQSKGVLVQDRTIFEDAEIFATNLFRQGLLSHRDFGVYREFYHHILKNSPPLDLMIYLKCSLPALKKRIAKRGRKMEKAVPDEYLHRLNTLYNQWIKKYKLSPVLVYPTDKIDYLTDFIHRQELLEQIGKYL